MPTPKRRPKAPRPKKDRRWWLVAAGSVNIVIGLLFLALVWMMFFWEPVVSATKNEPTSRTMLLAGAVELLMSAAFIWLGVGLCLCRRWARALSLIVACFWMVMGVLAIPAYLWMSEKGPASSIQWVTGAFLVTGYVVLPAILFALLQGKPANDTCRYYDPHPRWTDRRPLPLLALSLMLGWSATSFLWQFAHPVLPFFGLIVTGWPAMLASTLLSSAMAWIAWEVHQLRVRAWWGGLLATILTGLSVAVTFAIHGAEGYFEIANFSAQELEQMKNSAFFKDGTLNWTVVLTSLAYVAFFIYCRRYFLVRKKRA